MSIAQLEAIINIKIEKVGTMKKNLKTHQDALLLFSLEKEIDQLIDMLVDMKVSAKE